MRRITFYITILNFTVVHGKLVYETMIDPFLFMQTNC